MSALKCCDQCNRVADEQTLGWLEVRVVLMGGSVEMDFCSKVCLAIWASEAAIARGESAP